MKEGVNNVFIQNQAIPNNYRDMVLELLKDNEIKFNLLKEYWDFLDETKAEAIDQANHHMRTEASINDEVGEVRYYIKSLVENEIYPIISVPKQYDDAIKNNGGIKAHETDIPGLKLIAGIIADKPFKYDDSDRVFYEIKCKSEDISPRFTGESKSFNGVVAWNRDFIPLSEMKKI